jgi:murein DD-endopeptidase MepM/ murein hydrolase activator NlpD
MHLADVHPELSVGDIVMPGEEIGLLGGTAVQDSTPHLHLDLETPEGVRVDPAPYMGLTTREDGEIPPCGRRR